MNDHSSERYGLSQEMSGHDYFAYRNNTSGQSKNFRSDSYEAGKKSADAAMEKIANRLVKQPPKKDEGE